MMKKFLMVTTILATSLAADVITVLPYVGYIDYDKENTKTVKEKSTLFGLHTSIGSLSYLLEFEYMKFNTVYKTDTIYGDIDDLNQDDISLAYGYYFSNIMLRGGAHYINTNDILLGDGVIGFATLGGYNFVDYDKYSYGLEGYYSYYKKGHDEKFVRKSIGITQLTPYVSAYNSWSEHWGNLISLKLNYQIAKDYIQDSYLSYEFSDTLYYRSLFLTLRGYTGEMRSGIIDSGFTVANTLDLIKNGYGGKVGYSFTPTAVLSVGYDVNSFREYGALEDGSNTVAIASFSYGF